MKESRRRAYIKENLKETNFRFKLCKEEIDFLTALGDSERDENAEIISLNEELQTLQQTREKLVQLLKN